MIEYYNLHEFPRACTGLSDHIPLKLPLVPRYVFKHTCKNQQPPVPLSLIRATRRKQKAEKDQSNLTN